MIGRTNTGSGGSGGTLTVTGVAGDAVTVSKDSKTYSRTFNSSGIATVKGLKTGTWTVTMTNGTKTATKTVTINADYTLTMAYFSATIKVTYPSGSTCTATCGSTKLTAPSTTGSWTCVVPNAGTWTIKCTKGSQSASSTVKITTDGQLSSVTLSYTLYIVKAGVIQSSGLSSYIDSTSRLLKLTQNEGSITISNNSSTALVSFRLTDVAVNLTAYDTLYCTGCQEQYSSDTAMQFGLSTAIGDNATIDAWVGGTAFGKTSATRSYDVSAMTGAYYVGFRKPAKCSCTVTVTDLWLE